MIRLAIIKDEGFKMNEWHNQPKEEVNKKMITMISMLAVATCLAILFAITAAHLAYVFS